MHLFSSKATLFIILFFGLNPFNTSDLHPLHVSTTEISYNSKQKSVEIVCKLFTDDFENALRKQNQTKIDLSASVLHNEMDVIIKKYIQNHLQITINGKKQAPKYIGFEIDREVVNVYLEIESAKPFEKIKIDNKILCDFFEDQMNIVHVELLGKRISGRLNNPDTQLEFKF
ncbi:MAG: peptidase E [Flavobacterium sp.]|uniref:DUF6702 family protein n=1 Tax=Flavobacterium sp. TaxID=239 RepID=UPI0026360453|nr:DUF6702 family protein [Flavobacterium sp.]MDD5151372.1 peptidase E [Flavobacterium sp.]